MNAQELENRIAAVESLGRALESALVVWRRRVGAFERYADPVFFIGDGRARFDALIKRRLSATVESVVALACDVVDAGGTVYLDRWQAWDADDDLYILRASGLLVWCHFPGGDRLAPVPRANVPRCVAYAVPLDLAGGMTWHAGAHGNMLAVIDSDVVRRYRAAQAADVDAA